MQLRWYWCNHNAVAAFWRLTGSGCSYGSLPVAWLKTENGHFITFTFFFAFSLAEFVVFFGALARTQRKLIIFVSRRWELIIYKWFNRIECKCYCWDTQWRAKIRYCKRPKRTEKLRRCRRRPERRHHLEHNCETSEIKVAVSTTTTTTTTLPQQLSGPTLHTHVHSHRQILTHRQRHLQTLHFQHYRCVLLFLFALWLRK